MLTCAAACAVFHTCAQPPLWPKLLFTGDYYWYHGPQAFYLDSALHDGEFPLWNPLTLCGQPFVHNPQVSAFYPPNLIRSLLTLAPTPARTHFGLIALLVVHMVIAALGMYVLSRDYGLSRGGTAVAVLAYVFGPTFVRRVLLQWVLVASAAWVPWQIFFLRRMIRAEAGRAKFFYAIMGAVVFAMNILAGFPQLTFYTALMMGFFFLLEWGLHLRCANVAEPGAVARRFFADGLSSALLFVTAVLLAACVLLPGKEFAGVGGRAQGQGFEVEAAPQDLTAPHILRSLIVYPGATAAEQGCRGAGLVVIVLGVAAFTHSRRRDVLLYAILFYIMTDCTLGPPFPFGRLVAMLDVLQFSSPWRAGIITGLPLAMLAGFGLDAATTRLRTRWREALRALALLLAGGVPAWFLHQWLSDKPYFVVNPAVLWIPLAALVVVVLAGFVGAPRVARTVIVLLVFAEFVVWNQTFVPDFIAKRSFRGDLGFLDGKPSFWSDNCRGGDAAPNMSFYRLEAAVNGYDPMRIEAMRLLVCDRNREKGYYRFVKDWEVTSENQRGNLFLKRSFWLARQYVRGPLPDKASLFPATTTVFFPREVPDTVLPEIPREIALGHGVSDEVRRIPVANAAELSRLTRPYSRNRMRITLPIFDIGRAHGVLCFRYRSQTTSDVAMAFTDPVVGALQHGKHGRMHPTGNTTDTLEVPLPAFDRARATMTYDRPADGPPPVIEEAWILLDNADEDRLIRIVDRRRNSVEVELTDLPNERILLFVDAWYPGWTAEVDGQPTPIYEANDAFKAIVVGKGTHRVRFAFSARSVTIGVAVSLMTGVLVLFVLARGVRGTCCAQTR